MNQATTDERILAMLRRKGMELTLQELQKLEAEAYATYGEILARYFKAGHNRHKAALGYLLDHAFKRYERRAKLCADVWNKYLGLHESDAPREE